jgi:hypothetical protein
MRNLIEEGLKVGDTLYRQSTNTVFVVNEIDFVSQVIRLKHRAVFSFYRIRPNGDSIDGYEVFLPEPFDNKN